MKNTFFHTYYVRSNACLICRVLQQGASPNLPRVTVSDNENISHFQCLLFHNFSIFHFQKQFLLLLQKNLFFLYLRYLAKISSFSRCSLRLLRARYPTQMIINRMGIRQASTMPLVMPA
ncbi:hypothetical protein ALC60_06436 [Trachymyrmex zeteki]|uniref:Uncharacterized protein n=1 Tax=Mycetomoellerius zeteki TaxID=64791 RepID=A0A151X2P4_9HYME|nr:hypothetical protein ALC60_06436 [Trachymyrmex zeteki]